MPKPNTYRIAAAFQAEKDPQQDAVIAWLGALPKDVRGDVKRSVMKYHLTRALLLYMQSGADTSTALHVGGSSAPARPTPAVPAAVPTQAASVVAVQPPVVATLPAAPAPVDASEGAVAAVPVLTDTVKKKSGGLRGKIAKSMQGPT